MLVLLPHVHRPSHDHQRRITVEVRNGIAGVEFDNVPGDSIGVEKIAKYARVFDIEVLED
jgi:hypothetical protein